MPSRSPRARAAARVAGVSALATGIVTAIAVAAVTVAIARRVVTPPRKRTEDIRILGVGKETVTLSRTADSRTPGTYGLWFDGGNGHARIGEILDQDSHSVTRELIGIDFGDLTRARRARINGWFYLRPRELGFPFQDVQIPMKFGLSPAWLIPAAPGKAASDGSEPDDARWVIQVHGRAVSRSEGLRSVPVFRAAGYTSLLISYRNDGDAAKSPDGRYGLGETEWHDVDSAIEFAIDRGAKSFVLMGWSMGGAMVLQVETQSTHRDAIRGVVLDSPVIDWVDVLDYQGAAMLVPSVIRRAALAIIGGKISRRLTGQSQAINLASLDFVKRADELTVPVLLFHSDDDGYVPAAASRALALARPDIVTFEEFAHGRHAKLWNYDPERWNSAISRWLATLPTAPIVTRAASGRTARSTRRSAAGRE